MMKIMQKTALNIFMLRLTAEPLVNENLAIILTELKTK